jgi:uncharacterized membrane protein
MGIGCGRPLEVVMIAFLGLLLVIWLVFVVLGFVIKGLFWLVIVGAVLFVGTAAVGYVKRKAVGGR